MDGLKKKENLFKLELEWKWTNLFLLTETVTLFEEGTLAAAGLVVCFEIARHLFVCMLQL